MFYGCLLVLTIAVCSHTLYLVISLIGKNSLACSAFFTLELLYCSYMINLMLNIFCMKIIEVIFLQIFYRNIMVEL